MKNASENLSGLRLEARDEARFVRMALEGVWDGGKRKFLFPIWKTKTERPSGVPL